MNNKQLFIKRVPANVEGRDFVVGDIHGCFSELGNLLKHVDFNTSYDRLFSVGDLIDRGPQSYKVLSLLDHPWFHVATGNHEDMQLLKTKIIENNVKKLSEEEEKYVIQLGVYNKMIRELPLVIEVEHLILGKYYIVHSEVLPEHISNYKFEEIDNEKYKKELKSFLEEDKTEDIIKFFNKNEGKNIDKHLRKELIWSRKIISQFYSKNEVDIKNGNFDFLKKNKIDTKYKIFCGHNIVPFPMKIGQQYYIDTGAALGYKGNEKKGSKIFTRFGHKDFALTMVDVTTGVCYGCISSEEGRGQVKELNVSLY